MGNPAENFSRICSLTISQVSTRACDSVQALLGWILCYDGPSTVDRPKVIGLWASVHTYIENLLPFCAVLHESSSSSSFLLLPKAKKKKGAFNTAGSGRRSSQFNPVQSNPQVTLTLARHLSCELWIRICNSPYPHMQARLRSGAEESIQCLPPPPWPWPWGGPPPPRTSRSRLLPSRMPPPLEYANS